MRRNRHDGEIAKKMIGLGIPSPKYVILNEVKNLVLHPDPLLTPTIRNPPSAIYNPQFAFRNLQSAIS